MMLALFAKGVPHICPLVWGLPVPAIWHDIGSNRGEWLLEMLSGVRGDLNDEKGHPQWMTLPVKEQMP